MRVVVVLTPFVGGDYYGAIIRGVNRECVRAGTTVVAVQTLDPGARTADRSALPARISLAGTRRADGVLVLPGALDTDHVVALQEAHVPVVLIGHDVPGVVAPSVRSDNGSGIRAAVDHLQEHGHCRIAFAGYTDSDDVHERYEAFLAALDGRGTPEFVPIPDNHETGGAHAADVLADGMDVSAVVLGTDRNAIGLLAGLRRHGVRVPDDVAVAGFDDIPDCRYESPALTSVRQPLEGLGTEAVRILRSLATGRVVPTAPVRLPADLVVRASCGCPAPGLLLEGPQARAQFESLQYLQSTLNTQYDLDVALLGSSQSEPRSLDWLAATPATAGVLGLWSTGGRDVDVAASRAGRESRTLEIVSTYAGPGTVTQIRDSGHVEDVDFPPQALLDAADGTVGRIVFVVPVRGERRDWGLLAAVGRIQDDTPPGREMMNHSGAVLTAALDRQVMLEALQQQQDQLQRMALHDQLTGLPNRANLAARLAAAADRSVQDPSFRYGLVFVDLDDFKAVNDTHGHAVGDALLRVVAERLRAVTRDDDIVARLGGDEFLLLVHGVDAPRVLTGVVRRLRRALFQPAVCDGVTVTPAASIGVVSSQSGDSSDELLRLADAAMYRAKRRSRAARH